MSDVMAFSRTNGVRVYTADATGNTGIVIEGSDTGAFAGEETVVFTGSGFVTGLISETFANYRLTVTGGGRYGLSPDPDYELFTDKPATRLSIRNWVDDAESAPIMLPKGPEMTAYVNGSAASVTAVAGVNLNPFKVTPDDPGTIIWIDGTHPSDTSPDGLPARARQTAVAMLHAFQTGPAAAQNRWVPVFNRANWTPEYVEVWYEAPDGSTPEITTTRRARSEAPIGTDLPHRAEVMGFWINGQPAQRAEIAGGRVRVYPDGFKAEFDSEDFLEFQKGGASATQFWPEDYFAEHWKNLPIAVMGHETLDGIALEPLPDPDDLANTLVGEPVLVLDGTRTLTSPGLAAAGLAGAVTLQARLKMDKNLAAGPRVFEQTGGGIILDWLSNTQSLRLSVRDSTGANVVLNQVTPQNFLLNNTYHTVTLSIDLATDTVKLWVDELEFTPTFATPSSGLLIGFRVFDLVDSTLRGEMRFSQMWLAAATGPDLGDYVDGAWVDGADGLGAPFKRAQADAGGSLIQLGTAPAW